MVQSKPVTLGQDTCKWQTHLTLHFHLIKNQYSFMLWFFHLALQLLLLHGIIYISTSAQQSSHLQVGHGLHQQMLVGFSDLVAANAKALRCSIMQMVSECKQLMQGDK